MKILAQVVNLNSPTGSKQDYVYCENGFFRELQLFDGNDKLLAKSGANHPESNINMEYGGHSFLVLPNSKDVYLKLHTNKFIGAEHA